MSSSRKLGRRLFLGGAAATGAGLVLPWLETFASRGSAQTGDPPLRFVLVSVGHSVHAAASPEWIPTSTGSLVLPGVLSPLEPYRSRLTTVAGVDNLVAHTVGSNGHDASSRTLASCMPHAEALNPDGTLRPDAPNLVSTSQSGGPSIEYVMAQALGGSPITLRVGERNAEHRRTFRMDGSDDHGEPNPVEAFGRIFGTGMQQPTLTPLERLARRRATILDTVGRTYRSLAPRLSAADRIRLESHAGLIDSLVSDLGRTLEIVCTDPTLTRDPNLPTAASAFENGDGRQDLAIARTQNNLIAATLACTNARVVSLHYSNMQTNRFPWLNGGTDLFAGDWHAVAHRDQGTNEQRLMVMQWYFEILGDLLSKLANVPDGAGRTLLDNTIVLWTSSLGYAWHGTDDIPVIIASDPVGPLRTGRHFGYTNANRRSLGDLWVTMLNAMGVSATTYGWNRGVDPSTGRPFNRGPLTEILT